MENPKKYIRDTIIDKHEGGFQKMPNDKGNYVKGKLIGTNLGLSARFLSDYYKKDVTEEDLKSITKDEAVDIYYNHFYKRNKIDKLDSKLQKNVLDMTINSGANGIKILQRAAGFTGKDVDGIIGEKTLAKLRENPVSNEQYTDSRINYYESIAEKDPSQKGFLKGWKNRANSYRETEQRKGSNTETQEMVNTFSNEQSFEEMMLEMSRQPTQQEQEDMITPEGEEFNELENNRWIPEVEIPMEKSIDKGYDLFDLEKSILNPSNTLPVQKDEGPDSFVDTARQGLNNLVDLVIPSAGASELMPTGEQPQNFQQEVVQPVSSATPNESVELAEQEVESSLELKTNEGMDLGIEPKSYTTLVEDMQNITFEGMGDDLMNKFVSRNALGYMAQSFAENLWLDKEFDPSFNATELHDYDQIAQEVDTEDLAEILRNSSNKGDFYTNVWHIRNRRKREKEMNEYAQEHPVLSSVTSVGNFVAEAASFMPLSTAISAASSASKIKKLSDFTKASRFNKVFVGEFVEQGIMEYTWAQADNEYEFDPLLFAAGMALGTGLKMSAENVNITNAARELLGNEHGFINIATDEGKKLVDEVIKHTTDQQAIKFAEEIVRRKTEAASLVRKGLETEKRGLLGRLDNLDKQIKAAKPEAKKALINKKSKVAKKLKKFEDKLPRELETLLNGTHPKITAAVNPNLSFKTIGKDLGLPDEAIKDTKAVYKFLNLDKPTFDPNFKLEGDASYVNIMRNQLKEMSTNTRLNANEYLKKVAGSKTIKNIDNLPIIGKVALGNKLQMLASTDGPMSRYLFNKANLSSSENPYVASYYNWLSGDNVGRTGTSKKRAIETQQSIAKIHSGKMMDLYHTIGDKMYDQVANAVTKTEKLKNRAKGFLSPTHYEETISPLIMERMQLGSEKFIEKFGKELGDLADDFAKGFNDINKSINKLAKEAGVEGYDFDDTADWFHRSWDFRKARGVDVNQLQDTIYRAMKSQIEKLEIKIDDDMLKSQAKNFTYGIRNADITKIEGIQSDYIKLLTKLADKSEGVEQKTIRKEISRLKTLKAKHDAGDLANRMQMDMNVTMPDGTPLHALLEDNIIHTQRRYVERMSSRIAAAEHGMKNIDDIDDWIEAAEKAEIERFAAKGHKNPKAAAEHSIKAMREDFMNFKHGGMSGIDGTNDDLANDFVKLVKKYNYARLMQYTGISSIAELGGTLVEAGVSATLESIGSSLRQHFMDLYLDKPQGFTNRLYDDLSAFTGIGLEGTAFNTKGISRASKILDEGWLGNLENGIDTMARVTHAATNNIETLGRRVTANALAIKWANHFTDKETGGVLSAFFGSNGVSNRVLENSNLGKFDDAGKFVFNNNYKNIKKQLNKFAEYKDGRLVSLNLEKWDFETARHFGDVMDMQASHILVNPDSTTLALWQSSPVGQILNQFRTFTINATSKVAGHAFSNAAISSQRGDQAEMIKAAQKIFWGTALGTLSVGISQSIRKAGGEDEVDIFDEGLIKGAAIGFARSSIAGNIPALADSMSGAFGIDPIFEKTSTMGRSQNFFNLATTPTGQAIGGVGQGAQKVLQGDFKEGGMKLLKTSPLYRQMGMQQIFNFMEK